MFDKPLNPANIMQAGIDDIAAITGQDADMILELLRDGAGNKMVIDQWFAKNPQTVDERNDFYRNAAGYLYDLCAYNAWTETLTRYETIASVAAGRRVLDFGAGIGTLCMILKSRGVDVSYYDLKGILSEFSAGRFAAHGYDIPIYTDDYHAIDSKFDLIVFFDVLEHLENPVGVVVDVAKKLLNKNGLIYIFAPFSATETHPMHLIENGKKYYYLKDFEAELERNGIVRNSPHFYEVDNG